MFNIERCDFLDLFFDPEALRRLYWIRVKPDHRIDDQLTIKRITGDLPAPERSGSWSSTNIAMGVVNRSVTGTAKSLLIRKPVWSAAKMATDGNHVIDSPHVSHNPESALEFPSLIHSQTIDRDMADLENRCRSRAWENGAACRGIYRHGDLLGPYRGARCSDPFAVNGNDMGRDALHPVRVMRQALPNRGHRHGTSRN